MGGGIDIHASQLFAFAKELENLGVVGIFVVMLGVAILANYLLFRHAMHNCDALKDIKEDITKILTQLDKSNEIHDNGLEFLKENLQSNYTQLQENNNKFQSIRDTLEKLLTRTEVLSDSRLNLLLHKFKK